MKTDRKNLRAALESLGITDDGEDVAELCGRAAAAAFCAMSEQHYASQGHDVAYRAHHDFAQGWNTIIDQYWHDPVMGWSVVLNQLAITIPAGAQDEQLCLDNVPAGALFLAGSACTLMAVDAEATDPDDKAAVSQAVAVISGVASRLRPFAKTEHVMKSRHE